ncbi:hypothetical protein [Streptomyces syringium]|uniref:hypothetical protein n=1 Tax=Streptomyces syringium TaxID=76729 RepID=UPI0033AF9527
MEPLWARLQRGTVQALIVTATRAELLHIAGLTDSDRAHQILADRLTRRLDQQGGAHAVSDPVGWLLARGLARRPGCPDPRCDEGTRLDTGADCESCRSLIVDRRSVRTSTALQVAADMPQATAEQRRAACEQRLRARLAEDAAREAVARERADTERAARRAAAAQARGQAASDQLHRRMTHCEGCGVQGAPEECVGCAAHQAAEAAVEETVVTVLAASYGSTGEDHVAGQVEAAVKGELQRVCERARADGASDESLRALARLTAETTTAEYRRSALELLARSAEAETEAHQVYAAWMRGGRGYATRQAAHAAAVKAAEEARARVARQLFSDRLTVVRAWRSRAAQRHVPAPGTYAVGAAAARAALRAARAPFDAR